MSIVQSVVDGTVVQNTSAESKKTQSQENKDMFMQLLVAEMQYQDPLEPTDNSQYIQQLYSMSQTESVLEVQEDVEEMSTKNLVGKYVEVTDQTTNTSGQGRVDSIAKVDGEWKISINGEVFPASGITAVHDADYYTAVTNAENLTEMVKKLPGIDGLNKGHKDDLEKAVELYNSMDEYGKGFLEASTTKKLTDLVGRMNALLNVNNGGGEDDSES